MENKFFTNSQLIEGAKFAIVSRWEKCFEIDPQKDEADKKRALRSIELFPDRFANGFRLLTDTLEIDVELVFDRIANPFKAKGKRNDPGFLNQKCIDKIVCLSLWLDGVTDADMIEATANSRNKRGSVMDSHINNLVYDTFKAFTKFGSFGNVKQSTGLSMHEFKCMQSYNFAADRCDIKENTDQIREKYYRIGAADFKVMTAGTQGSQMKTMLITMGMVDPTRAIKDDYLSFNLQFSKLISRTMKTNEIKRIDSKKNG